MKNARQIDETKLVVTYEKKNEAIDVVTAIYRKTDEKGNIRTAYYMSLKRKERRYRKFRKLRPS